ncbi:MAG: type II secretion system minor pseudopilin GspJ [Gammaproteobacteria bacterium]|nr:type II secretion system minor pseudopilin GspJ [Gammaproteobacteria bacterium]NND60222.1 type II secretion system minor pseudopilin GspJ [Gammaproteobacteria bacterium]
MKRQAGFTLLELIVATAIFAIMSAMVYGTLAGVGRQLEASEQAAGSMRELHYALRRVAMDVAQLQPRPVRDDLGDLAGAIDTSSAAGAIELSVGGWRNPLRNPRGTTQRVAYVIDDDVLTRLHWPVLDRTLATEPLRIDLLSGVYDIQLRFLDRNGEWTEQWPPLSQGGDVDSSRRRPRAVEIMIEHEQWGIITRVIEIAG